MLPRATSNFDVLTATTVLYRTSSRSKLASALYVRYQYVLQHGTCERPGGIVKAAPAYCWTCCCQCSDKRTVSLRSPPPITRSLEYQSLYQHNSSSSLKFSRGQLMEKQQLMCIHSRCRVPGRLKVKSFQRTVVMASATGSWLPSASAASLPPEAFRRQGCEMPVKILCCLPDTLPRRTLFFQVRKGLLHVGNSSPFCNV